MFSRLGKTAFKKDLSNTLVLCDYFDNPQNKFKSIHVGGTNGKGSVVNYLASMLKEVDLRVGVYTSPHLFDFRERIKIGDQFICEDFVVDFVDRAKPVIEEINPSFFELTVVMAFDYFASQNLDLAIIEVGLGGRLDSTNVIQPELSVITNISLDHTDMLGHSIESIAFEKAGIIKENTPVVIGESDENYNKVFENRAEELGTDIIYASERVQSLEVSNSNIEFEYNNYSFQIDKSLTIPSYQLKNIKTTIAAFVCYMNTSNLRNLNLVGYMKLGIQNRTKNTGFMGRWTQMKYQGRNFILESAHNEAGIQELNKTLTDLKLTDLKIIYGAVNDKDLSKIVSLLPKDGNYVLTEANIPRAKSIADLGKLFHDNELRVVKSVADTKLALDYSIQSTNPKDTILVTGSIFIVGEILKTIKTV